MSSSPSHDGSLDALSGHLDALFELAQVVTSDVEEAISLVEQTVRRARQEGVAVAAMDPGSREQARIALYRILLDAHAKRSPWTEGSGEYGADTDASDTSTASFAGRLAEQFVDAAVPGAFATLDAEQRILLLLCDVQAMSCTEAGRVLNVDGDAACERLDRARLALSESVYVQATPVERRLIETGLSDDWRHRALRRMAESELSAIPPTVQPSLLDEASGVSGPSSSSSKGERVTGRRDGKRGMQAIARRAAAVLVVIALAGLVGYGLSYMTRSEPDANLISLSAGQAGEVDLAFQTTSAEQAERFVRDRLDRRIVIPDIEGASLQGISIRAVAEGAEVPVMVYGGPSQDIVVYVYSYAFLDRHRGSVELSSDVLNQIEEEGHFDLHDLGETKALVWRHRGDIYIAVTDGDAEALRDRIR
ncbi:MAG: hypothetical protein WD021_00590, partial [Rhodothermales bacterium]